MDLGSLRSRDRDRYEEIGYVAAMGATSRGAEGFAARAMAARESWLRQLERELRRRSDQRPRTPGRPLAAWLTERARAAGEVDEVGGPGVEPGTSRL
jgi:hypothetical protein